MCCPSRSILLDHLFNQKYYEMCVISSYLINLIIKNINLHQGYLSDLIFTLLLAICTYKHLSLSTSSGLSEVSISGSNQMTCNTWESDLMLLGKIYCYTINLLLFGSRPTSQIFHA